MLARRHLLPALMLAASVPVAAQGTSHSATQTTDTAAVDDEGVRLGFQFGVTSGALGYRDGRTEQARGGIVRWAPIHWFSVSVTPTGVRASSPPTAGSRQV